MLNKIRKMLKQQEGFTLVELMIVVVILGIISGIGIQQYGRVQENARNAANDANIRIIKSAAQMWAMTTSEEIDDSYDKPTSDNVEYLKKAGFLDSVPQNPWGEKDDRVYKLGYKENDNGVVEIKVVFETQQPASETKTP